MLRDADRAATRICAALVAAISSIVLSGWVFHLPLLTHVSLAFAPTQFDTALCFFLYATALLATTLGGKWIPRAIGGTLCALGVATLLQTLVGRNFGIETFLGYYIRVGYLPVPSRMADATAGALISLGAALWLYTYDTRSSRIVCGAIAALGSIPLAVAAGALLGYGAGAHSVTGWMGFTQIGVPTALVCMIAGAHLLWTAWQRSENVEVWLPIPILFGLLALVFTLTQELRDDEAANFSVRVQISAQEFGDRAQARLDDMLRAFDRMATRWDIGENTAQQLWTADASTYLRDFRGLVALECVDGKGRIRWAVPPLANPAVIEARLRDEPDRALVAAQARRLGAARITRVMPLTHGGTGFLYINPLRNRYGYDGLQIGVVRVSDFLASVFVPSDTGQFAISVTADNVPVYSSPGVPRGSAGWTRSVAVRVRNAQWILSVTPAPELVKRALSSLPEVFLAVGSLVSVLATIIVFLALKWRGNLRTLRDKENQLERSEERYELAVRGAGVGLWDFEMLTGEVYWSPRYRDILGIDDPDFVPRRTEFESRVHREDRSRIFPEILHAIESGVAYDGEARVRRNDGTYVWLRLRGVPTRDANGRVIRLAGSIDDISALKRAQDALKASEETFRITMDSSSVGISLLSPEKRLLRANRAMAKLLGYSHEDELLALDPRKVLSTAFDVDRAQVDRLLAGEIERYELEHELLTRNGKPIWVLTTASLARNPDGTPKHVVKQIMDISERKEMDRMKSEFISTVSHELRTPLTAIRGSMGLMATAMRSTLPEGAVKLVEIANRNCDRLIALVNDILDMEKLASDRMVFEPRCEDLNAMVRLAVETNASFGEKFGVSFRLPVGGGVLNAVVDQNRFAQVMANLLSNAAKFSPRGSQVGIFSREKHGCARIEVRDRGPGISDEFRPRIFERFMQADSSIARAKGGTGLGLYITKQLVERMGGIIGFESVAGHGTVFWIEFPMAKAVIEPARMAVS
jgi:PAS domain S-box-containing protein